MLGKWGRRGADICGSSNEIQIFISAFDLLSDNVIFSVDKRSEIDWSLEGG